MRRPLEITTLYQLVCERYPNLPHVVKGKLAQAAEKLVGAELCDREAQVRAAHRAIDETVAEYG